MQNVKDINNKPIYRSCIFLDEVHFNFTYDEEEETD